MRYLVKLRFKRGVHIGLDLAVSGDESVATMIHSDTLFSAIVNQWVRLPVRQANSRCFPQIEELIDAFGHLPSPFLLSSAFLFREEDYYLPTPITTGSLSFEVLQEIPFLELDDF